MKKIWFYMLLDTIIILILFSVIYYDFSSKKDITKTALELSHGKNAFSVELKDNLIIYRQFSEDMTVWKWCIYFKNDKYEKNEIYKFCPSKYKTLDVYVDGINAKNPNVQDLKIDLKNRFVHYTNLDLDRLFMDHSFEEGTRLINDFRFIYMKKMNEIQYFKDN
ncbi:MAG: hypothetical protein RR922_01705 [Clostridia bacterium]